MKVGESRKAQGERREKGLWMKVERVEIYEWNLTGVFFLKKRGVERAQGETLTYVNVCT